MRKNIISFIAALSLMLLGWGSAMAATSAMQNQPGGGGFVYFQASGSGHQTLFNIQNINQFIAIMVHVSLWDSNSNHLVDFNIPLSVFDNWGCTISGDGTNITITPQSPCFYAGPGNGCFAPLTVHLPANSAGMQIGYMSYVISGYDGLLIADGDPRNDLALGNVSMWIPDWIFARAAYLNFSQGSAMAHNGNQLQSFVNIDNPPGLVENVAGFAGGWDSIADAGVPFLYNCDNDINDRFPSRDDPGQGINIDSWEILLTNGAQVALVTDDYTADGVGDTLYNAVGAATSEYWARYNENPAIPSDTTLVVVFPANSGTLPVASSPACGYASRTMNIFCYDDNEWVVSTPITSHEVDFLSFDPAGIVVPGTSGECRIIVDAPMVGFTFTEAGNFADSYDVIDEGKWIYAQDGFNYYAGAMGLGVAHAPDGQVSEVIWIP